MTVIAWWRNLLRLVKRAARAFGRRADALLPLDLLARHALVAAGYLYAKGAYRAEQRALLSGLAKYRRSTQGGDPLFQLRRNIHRIEKGLSSANRRPIFAETYIDETLNALERVVLARQEASSEPTIRWAYDVLDQFFTSTEGSDILARASKRFERTVRAAPREESPEAPYPYYLDSPAVGFADLRKLVDQRVSIRRFKAEHVERSLLTEAVDLAMQSPSACNRIPYEFRFYDDPSLVSELAHLAPGMRGWGETVPCICVLVGKYRAYFHVRDRHAIYVDAALAAMPFQLALVSLGLGSCSVNWPQLPGLEYETARLLNLESDEKIVMLIAIGYPEAGAVVPYSSKRSLHEVASFNRR